MVRALSDNNDSTAGEVHFTPRRATQMLPLVRRIVADILRLNQSITLQREQIKGIDHLPETISQADYQEELRDIRASLEADEQRLESCLNELNALGIEPHQPLDGTIDFPAVMNRRRVWLCWHPDDERVEHWHESGQSADQRKKIESHSFGHESVN